MFEPVRILLLEMPPLLRELLEHAVASHGGCQLVQESGQTFEALFERDESPDVVLLGLETATDAMLVRALFARWPRVQVMTMTRTGDNAVLYEFSPQRTRLREMSPTDIVEALHESAQRSRQ